MTTYTSQVRRALQTKNRFLRLGHVPSPEDYVRAWSAMILLMVIVAGVVVAFIID